MKGCCWAWTPAWQGGCFSQKEKCWQGKLGLPSGAALGVSTCRAVGRVGALPKRKFAAGVAEPSLGRKTCKAVGVLALKGRVLAGERGPAHKAVDGQ